MSDAISHKHTYSNGIPVLCALAQFYVYRQNNPSGRWVFSAKDGVSLVVVIEATSVEQAWEVLESFASQDYCPCCGPRWYTDPDDVLIEPPIHFQDDWRFDKARREGVEPVYLHRMDGTIMPVPTVRSNI